MENNKTEIVLKEIFFDGYEDAIIKLKKHELLETTEKYLDYYFKIFDEKKASNFNVVFVAFVQTVNTTLRNIKNVEEVEELKYLLSNIGNHLMDKLLNNNIITIDDLKITRDSLISVFNLQGFDYKDFEGRTHLNRIISIVENQNLNMVNLNPVYYEWLGNTVLFDEISKNLKSKKYILSIKDFKKIFTPEPSYFVINENVKDFFVVLFDLLYEKKLLTPKVKRGHLAPLKIYARDFDNKILYEKEMKHIKFIIKNNSEKYNELRSKAEKWLKY